LASAKADWKKTKANEKQVNKFDGLVHDKDGRLFDPSDHMREVKPPSDYEDMLINQQEREPEGLVLSADGQLMSSGNQVDYGDLQGISKEVDQFTLLQTKNRESKFD